ncbi:glutamate-5-semialdehyde dehydrogenase [Stratiformator vulcanicus]|uniref:Gamma-glutamyl phosphate reductase n=1 Tax=Stratiformator vulcanicus TaxID=2527980 RepID=A0A517R5Q4_9PLAN|nr:glutamate-5-semialdehyde dehydrogenase [Stratiformator vulcanicus]QDT39211.1 Gamma-glutamyl phosphate reductase [Stratiformator vulcanicus]
MTDLQQYAVNVATKARAASRVLVAARGETKNLWLTKCAAAIRERRKELQAENQRDLDKAPEYGLTEAAIDRLELTDSRLESIATAIEEIIALPDPVGRVLGSNVRPNGLNVTKVRVPLGVIFFIYESRPNVTVDAAALCVKSGNAIILRGGKEAFHSNQALHALLSEILSEVGLPADAVQMVTTTDREAVGHFLKLGDEIDLTIPRGGKGLIQRVTADAAMPVLKHLDGVCHVYIDRSADISRAIEITVNSKAQRPGVCNAAESLLVHAAIATDFLPAVYDALSSAGVEIVGCERTREILPQVAAASEEDFRTEYLALKISVRVVDSTADAIEHVNKYGSGHTESIVTTDIASMQQFTTGCDSAAVIVNASTRFNDGGEFGLGAEIGISTDKFHARGPCGLEELTTYKYVAFGDGQIRE